MEQVSEIALRKAVFQCDQCVEQVAHGSSTPAMRAWMVALRLAK